MFEIPYLELSPPCQEFKLNAEPVALLWGKFINQKKKQLVVLWKENFPLGGFRWYLSLYAKRKRKTIFLGFTNKENFLIKKLPLKRNGPAAVGVKLEKFFVIKFWEKRKTRKIEKADLIASGFHKKTLWKLVSKDGKVIFFKNNKKVKKLRFSPLDMSVGRWLCVMNEKEIKLFEETEEVATIKPWKESIKWEKVFQDDFNNDGKWDLLAVFKDGKSTCMVFYLGKELKPGRAYKLNEFRTMCWGDFDGDKRKDFLIALGEKPPFICKGNPSLRLSGVYTDFDPPTCSLAVDENRDGITDLLLGYKKKVLLFRGERGKGIYPEALRWWSSPRVMIKPYMFGKDCAVGNPKEKILAITIPFEEEILLFNVKKRAFKELKLDSVPQKIVLKDINKDGFDELFVKTKDNTIIFYGGKKFPSEKEEASLFPPKKECKFIKKEPFFNNFQGRIKIYPTISAEMSTQGAE